MKNFTNGIFGIFFLLIYLSPLYAQSGVGKLSGKVIDASTREPLIGANIVIVNTDHRCCNKC